MNRIGLLFCCGFFSLFLVVYVAQFQVLKNNLQPRRLSIHGNAASRAANGETTLAQAPTQPTVKMGEMVRCEPMWVFV